MYHVKISNKKGLKRLSIYIMLTFMSPKFNLDLVLLTKAISLKCRMVAFLERGGGGHARKGLITTTLASVLLDFILKNHYQKIHIGWFEGFNKKSEKQIRFYCYLLLKTCMFNTKLFCGSNCCRGESNSPCRHCGGYCSWCC